MKTSAKWRAWLMIAGVFLGLLASIGMAAPAGASTVVATSSHSQADRGQQRGGDANLSLRIFGNGDYRVRGTDYEAKRVHVWVVNVSRDRVVNEFYVRTHHGDFTSRNDGLRCDRTYKAVSFSRNDGWVSSNKVRFHCDHR